jgi:hypothetical protein
MSMSEEPEFVHKKTWPLPDEIKSVVKLVPLNPHIGLLFIHTNDLLILYHAQSNKILDKKEAALLEISQILQVDSTRVLCAYTAATIQLFEVENNQITGPKWISEDILRGHFGFLDVTPNRDKFIFSHGPHLSMGDMQTGKIEATWESGTDYSCYLVKVLSDSLVACGRYEQELHISDILKEKYSGVIETELRSIYEWGSFSDGKFLLCGTSGGDLLFYDAKKELCGVPIKETRICHGDIIFIFEIAPDFLIIFDMHRFHFFDLDSMELVPIHYPNLVMNDTISWINRLSNGNFLVQYGHEPEFIILDFCSKMWSTFRWLFLAFSDARSKFGNLPRDILVQILLVAHLPYYVL